MKKYVKQIELLVICLIAITGVSFLWINNELATYTNHEIKIDKDTLITINEGATYYSVIDQLVESKMIEPSFLTRLAVKVNPRLSLLKTGTYQVKPKMTFNDVFQLINSGKEHQFSITFIEGTRFSQWREELAKSQYLDNKTQQMSEAQIAAALGVSYPLLEGLLLPETYHYSAGESDLSILKRAFEQLNSELKKAWQIRSQDLPIKNEYQLLTLASIIEKETAVDSERTKVASVFVNRLNNRMRLQTDPTVIYGMGEDYDGDIRKKDLRTPTPYNTYVIFGLPPTPIAMPSKASINAAANPAQTPYFYFVANGLGGHQFSSTLTEHNRAVKQYLNLIKNK